MNASAIFDEKAYEREIQELRLKLSKAEKAKEARCVCFAFFILCEV